ncbi:hypothetical protein C6497_05070 [Candidatus Poribacteria bacterium]|nr:MAG: hypothetical protein C6497_05070 [Candidatus Poribacteria bacterium]
MKSFRLFFTIIFILLFTSIINSNEVAKYYFPDKLGSLWTYEDQDGNEFTRYAIEETTIDGVSFRAFSYDPEIDDWEDYKYIMHPFLYQVSDHWISLYVGNDIENGTKSIVTNKMQEVVATMRQEMAEKLPDGITMDFDFSVEPTAQDYFYLMPISEDNNDDWVAMNITLKVVLKLDLQGVPVEIPEELKSITATTTLEQTGSILDTESIETNAGIFDDCFKIQYRLTATTDTSLPQEFKQFLPDQETGGSTTTIWFAPNVGIVKYTSEEDSGDVETIELTNYEIKNDNAQENNEK